MRSLLGVALAACALAGAACGDDEAEQPGTRSSADTPSAAGAEEYDLALPDDGVEGDVPPGVGQGG